MSGGPQVFLGATTFLSGCCAARFLAAASSPAAARSPTAARPARPRDLATELRSVPRLEARPGPAGLAAASNRAAPRLEARPCPPVPPAPSTPVWPGSPGLAAASNRAAQLLSNVARNSLARLSNIEVSTLELQRFERGSKTDPWKLCATFVLADVVASSHRQRDPARQ